MAWQDFNENLGSIGDYLREQSARKMIMEDARQKNEMNLQNAIAIVNAKAQSEANMAYSTNARQMDLATKFQRDNPNMFGGQPAVDTGNDTGVVPVDKQSGQFLINPNFAVGASKIPFIPNSEVKRDITRSEKENQFNQKEWDKIVKDSDPMTASSRSTLGMAANANLRADRAIVTLNNPMVTKQMAQNAIADIAAIYQGGSPTDIGMKHSDYQSLQSKAMNMLQYFTGNPQDALPGTLKQKILQTLDELKSVNHKAINSHFDYIEKSKSKIIKSYSDEWKQIRNQYAIDNSPTGITPTFGSLSGVSNKINMQAPDGKSYTVSMDEVQDAEQNGWKRI